MRIPDQQAHWTHVARSEDDTDRFGVELAGVLTSSDIVAFNGELGAGKTRLVRAIVNVLCPQSQPVSSPTFVLVQRYEGRLPVFHFDTYRLADVDEFLALGVEEIFEEGGVCLIEWAERVAEVLPQRTLEIRIRATGEQSREFQLFGSHARSTEIIRELRSHIG